MSKKLSIIRFKPKPEHYDDFLQDVIENGKEREPGTHFVIKKDDEVIAIVIRCLLYTSPSPRDRG